MHFSNPKNPWVYHRLPRAQARLRLFCFPFAGGGASIFRTWPEQLPAEIDVYAIQLPGREMRLAEAPVQQLAPLIAQLIPIITPYLDQPYAFFGHSMGALISFELAHALAQRGHKPPVRLLISGHRAPHLPPTKAATYHLPQDAFIDELKRLQGTPAEVLQNEELLQLMLPLLRADFELCETYQYSERTPLELPITALGGIQDQDVARSALEAWKVHTSKDFTIRFFNGGHFYLQHEQGLLLNAITKDLLLRTVLK